jgi:hypothetical protein
MSLSAASFVTLRQMQAIFQKHVEIVHNVQTWVLNFAMRTRLYGSGRQPRFRLLFFLAVRYFSCSVPTYNSSSELLLLVLCFKRSHDLSHISTFRAPRDEICLFAPDIPCGFSLRSYYVFIPVLSIHQRVFLQDSELATPRWSPFVLSNYVVLERFLTRINYMIYTNRPGSPMITLHRQYVHISSWIQPFKCVHPSCSAPLTQNKNALDPFKVTRRRPRK